MPDGRDRLRRRMRSGPVRYRCVNATAGECCWSPLSGTPETRCLALPLQCTRLLCCVAALSVRLDALAGGGAYCGGGVAVRSYRGHERGAGGGAVLRWSVGAHSCSCESHGMRCPERRVSGGDSTPRAVAEDRAVGERRCAGAEAMTELRSRDEAGGRKEPEW
ncbi:hypothetical protein B0H13DRAFT_1857333 [Mycena leptocephala]|nr:hypothetical protein B0H13DRAFT_1857333 [Mycena leptocephala]